MYRFKFVSYRFGTISGTSKGMRFHTAINKFSFYAVLGRHLPLWKSMMNKPRPYLSLRDAFKVIKFTIEKNLFNNEVYNILSQHLTLRQIISFFNFNHVFNILTNSIIATLFASHYFSISFSFSC